MKKNYTTFQKQHLQHFETTSATFENTSQHPATLKHPDLLFQHPRKTLQNSYETSETYGTHDCNMHQNPTARPECLLAAATTGLP
jgi:hypothetical protein